MKNFITFTLAYLFCHIIYGQKPFTSIDLGYQVGNEQFFEAGLNLSLMVKKPIIAELSVGIEDNINSKLTGYKLGFMAYDGLGVSTLSPEAKPIPLIMGVSIISYNYSDKSTIAYRPEIGLRGIWRHGRGRSITKLIYGYNFIDSDLENQINKHLVRLSISTNWKSFLDIFGVFIK